MEQEPKMPSQEKELYFDLFKEAPKVLEEAREFIEKSKGEGDWANFIDTNIAVALKIAEPNYNLSIEESGWRKMDDFLQMRLKRFREDYRKNIDNFDNWYIGCEMFAECAKRYKLLNPERGLTIDDTDWDNMLRLLSELKKDKSFSIMHFVDLAVAMKIIRPSFNLTLPDEIRLPMEETWESDRDLGEGLLYADVPMKIKIINPDYDLKLNKSTWLRFRETLQFNEDKLELAMRQIMGMKILSARNVEVTNSGLEIIF